VEAQVTTVPPRRATKTLAAIDGQQFDQPEVLRAANRLLREVINFHLGGKELRTRKVLRDIHRM